jgi:hypothetical protein
MGRDKDQPPASDTATDWDEWMERHAERPRPVPDVANAEGRFTRDTTAPAQPHADGAEPAGGQSGAGEPGAPQLPATSDGDDSSDS